MKNFTVQLYRGCPETAGDSLDEMLEKGNLTPFAAKENGCYDLSAGVYSCHITGESIHPTLKVIAIKEDRRDVCLHEFLEEIIVPVCTSGGRAEGYQPTVVAPDAPEYFKRTQKDELLCIWPDEILDIYSDSAVPQHHQCMKQDEMEAALGELEGRCDILTCYPFGKSQHYGFTIPLAVLSKEKLSGCWQEALGQLAKSEKVNIWYQAQIHGNEPAACDGALAVLEAFCEEEELQDLLHHVNLVVVPRANPEAAYLYRRMAYDNIDLNRDHMACDAYETRLLHQAAGVLEPEVVLDGHEFTFFVTDAEDGEPFVKKGCEIMSSPATSLNIAGEVRAWSYAVCGQVFDELKKKDYRIYHFGTAEKASFGRCFYGLHQCLSFLIETRGIGGGRYGYDKRVRAQKDIMLAYIKNVAASAGEIKETVAKARLQAAEMTELVLQHESSEQVFTPYQGINEQYYLNGNLYKRMEEGLQLNDFALRMRKAADAYVVPADAEHIESILGRAENTGCEVLKLDPGTCLKSAQYRCIGLREEGAHEKDIVAELMPYGETVFDAGAWLFSASDYHRVLLAMLMEPDVTDTVGTKGTLYQQNLMDYDGETGLFPLYRTEWL
ncbi:MAG: hypothetical protein IKJ77_06770 [Firmicutes bacterium]|nr:hypothetical protein [Bacillota bacterium]